MVLPLLVAGYLFHCYQTIPSDLRSETYYDPYSCDDCPDINKDIQFHLYTRSYQSASLLNHNIIRPDNDSTLENSPFNRNHKTFIFIHGFREHANSSSARTMRIALLQHGDYNVILVNWGNITRQVDYCGVLTSMQVTGTYVAQMIKSLEKTFSISRTSFHVIGFSLGAHISGLTGEALARNDPNKIKIGRITGLDPAGPAFEASNGLDKTDATFVDIIHTNTNLFGMKKSIGHVDFYVNYGMNQPGCNFEAVACSHQRAWIIFAESISRQYEFPAFRCANPGIWRSMKLFVGRLSKPESNCEDFQNDYMGFIASEKSKGDFVVLTSDEPPYGLTWGTIPLTEDEMFATNEIRRSGGSKTYDNSFNGIRKLTPDDISSDEN